MKSAIDSAGRVVIPRAIREQAGLRPGTPLQISVDDGRVVLESAPLEVRLEKRGKLTVAVAQKKVPPLRTELVNEAIRRSRERSDD